MMPLGMMTVIVLIVTCPPSSSQTSLRNMRIITLWVLAFTVKGEVYRASRRLRPASGLCIRLYHAAPSGRQLLKHAENHVLSRIPLRPRQRGAPRFTEK